MANRQIKDLPPITEVEDSHVLHVHTGVNTKIRIDDFFQAIEDELIQDATLSQKGVVQLGNSPAVSSTTAATVGYVTSIDTRVNSIEGQLEYTLVDVVGGNGMGTTTYDGSEATIVLGTPSTLTTMTSNSVTPTSHTHQVNFPVTSVAGQTGDVVLEVSDIVDAGTAATGNVVVNNVDTTGGRLPTVDWINANVSGANPLYKGPWESQTGQAVPPYWVDYGGGENLVLHSENLDTTWTPVRLETVTDSGIAAPTINGQSFGNYWNLIPTTENAAHRFWQPVTAPSTGQFSFLVRPNGYNFVYVKLFPDSLSGVGLASFRLDMTDGSLIDIFNIDVKVVETGDGGYFVTASWTDTPGILKLYIDTQQDGNANFAGNGTDGILITRVQVATPNARYVKTTDTPAPYTPPKIYELQAPVDAIESEAAPGTDETVWKVVGSGGGGGASTGPYSIVPAVELSADDQDGSGNIAVTLDLSEGTVWAIDCTNSPLMSTSGNINVTVTGLPEDSNTGITFQVYFKRAGRKGVNWTLPAGVTASWAGTQSYGSLASSVDVVQGYWLSTEPDIMHLSVIDKR